MIDVCNIREIKSLLTKYGFHFSKSKGQNFLTDRSVPERIAEESGIDASCGVIEIGPGFGSLTQALCPRAGRVVALEVDASLGPVLAETVGAFENLKVLYCDALKAELPALVSQELAGLKPVACANLPYYITSPVLAKLLESRCFETITVMVQREVAHRICARAGTADYSAFTLLCQYYAAPELLFEVPPECFIPQPKVTSAVVQMRVRPAPAEITDEALFFRTVRAAFAMRRKTLLNGLKAGFPTIDKEGLLEALEACGIAPSVRGETLDLAQFAALSNALAQKL